MAFPSILLPTSSQSSSSFSCWRDGSYFCWWSALLDQWSTTKNHPPAPTGHMPQEHTERIPDHMAAYLWKTKWGNEFCFRSRKMQTSLNWRVWDTISFSHPNKKLTLVCLLPTVTQCEPFVLSSTISSLAILNKKERRIKGARDWTTHSK